MRPSDRWRRPTSDPDLRRDLGYEIAEWDAHRVEQHDGVRVVLVPADEDAFDREAYIVVSEDTVVDTFERR